MRTPPDPLDADRRRLADMIQDYANNLKDVAYALRANQLGDLAHTLSDGKAVPSEQWGQLLGAEMQAGLTPIVLLCGRLWGASMVQVATDRRQERETTRLREEWAIAEERREQQRRADLAREQMNIQVEHDTPTLHSTLPRLPQPWKR